MCEHHGPATDLHDHHDGDTGIGRRLLVRGAGGVLLAGGAIALGAPGAAAATSQNGWPAGTSSTVPLAGLTVGAATFPAGVRSGQVHTVLGYVARRFDREVEALVKGWCWGHAYRPIRGASTLSNHASGTAIDCNAPRHPLGRSGTFSSAQRARIQAILADCDGVVRWGGSYSGRKDEMHFEINVRPGDARLAALVRRIGGGGGGTTPPATTWSTVTQGASGFRVAVVQHLLRQRGAGLTADGVFGAATRSAVVSFQRSARLTADGIVGPRTWAALVVTVKQGSRGQAVVAAQKALTARGHRLAADGIFGAGTKAAVVAYQRAHGLTADGIVGPRTWARLTL
jgi:putative peptidoglycan binding protein/D-alanyl-D-alanine carboxypeptidase-like protein